MVVAIVILLLFVASALVGAMYSNFTAFLVNFTDISQYNKAYYSAVSGLERAELVLRYRAPWYEGSGGWIGSEIGISSTGDQKPDSDFSFISSEDRGGILREITSRTKRIPAEDEGNIDWMLASGNRLDYNRLDYANAENFTFMLDQGNGNPYNWGTVSKNPITSFTGIVRLPYLLEENYDFWPLDVTDDRLGGGLEKNGDKNDPIVDWSFRRESVDGSFWWQVMSTQDTGDYYLDSRLLEGRINLAQVMDFWATYSPFSKNPPWWGLSSRDARLTGIVENSDDIGIFNGTFSSLLENWDHVLFRLSLLNPLYSVNDRIFPYLEYQFTFPDWMADRYYSITTRGKNGNYEVQLFMQKPTIVESILRSFTVIF